MPGGYSSGYSSGYDTEEDLTLKTIREGMASLVDNVTALKGVYARTPKEISEDDVAIVEIAPPGIVPSGHINLAEVWIRVIVIVQRSTGTEAEDALDAYLWPSGTNSIIAAVMADQTLAGSVSTTEWKSSAYPYGVPEGAATGRQSEALFKCGLNY